MRGDDLVVDGAGDRVAFYGDGDDLGDRLADAGGFVDRVVFDRGTPAELERCGAESAKDERAVSVSGTVEVARVCGAEIVAADHDAVRMRMVVDAHIF